jgi:ParB/RepB/Spo0J family partition protein
VQTEQIIQVPTVEINESPFHRRQQWGDLKAFAAELKADGILQPLEARQRAGVYELTFGHRRLRAAKQAKLATVPVVVRERTDQEVIELQLVENAQREGAHPMDVAESFGELDKLGRTIEQIAARFGCETAFVRQRMKLLALAPEVRKAYLAGKLLDEVAFEIARIAAHEAQLAVLKHDKWVLEDPQRMRNLIRKDYMLDLARAPFSTTDGALVPDAGACSACPKRTGQQRELFADVAKKEDLCLDAPCYRRKCAAQWELVAAAAIDAGEKIIAATQAKKIFRSYASHDGRPRELEYGAKYVEARTSVGYVGSKQIKGTWQSALGKHAPPKVHVLDPDGRPRVLYEAAAANRALAAAGKVSKAAAESERGRSAPSAADRAHRKRAKIGKLVAIGVLRAIGTVKIEPVGMVRALAVLLLRGHGQHETEKLLGKEHAAVRMHIDKASSDQLERAVLRVALCDRYYGAAPGPEFLRAAKLAGVDVAKIQREAAAVKPKAKSKSKSEMKPPKGETTKKGRK